MTVSKIKRRLKIKKRIRKRVTGTSSRPRLSVFRSNCEIYAQLVNDETNKTIVSVSSRDKDFKSKGTKTEIALEVGKLIGKKAKTKGIEHVAFDRNGYLYHGRVKSLAQGARESGMKF